MANAYTDTSANSLGTSLVQAAYDRYVEFALRAVPLIRDVADKKPVQQAMPGSSVVFQIYTDLTPATSTLSETVDPDAVALGNTTSVSVTLGEYGNASLATRKLELFSLSDVDPAIADIIAFNMADSLDSVAQTVLRQGDNVIYATGGSSDPTSTVTVAAEDVIASADIRRAVAKLRAGKAVPRTGEFYWCGMHPEVSHDLRAETGAGGWREAHVYNESGAGQLWPGSIGTYEGAMFVESPRLYVGVDGADQSTVTRTAASGVSGAFTFVVTASVLTSGIKVGDKASGTGVGSSAKITAISTDGLTLTVDVANSTTVSGTITFTPVTKVYRTIVAGKQALAEAVAEEPHVVFGPVVDKLMRFRPIGWYGVLGWSRYREAALYRIESSSSIA